MTPANDDVLLRSSEMQVKISAMAKAWADEIDRRVADQVYREVTARPAPPFPVEAFEEVSGYTLTPEGFSAGKA